VAAQHLTVLSHPDFPQVFPRAIDQEVTRVERILLLPTCQHEVPGFRPCDAQPCGRRATASSIALQIPVCPSHMAELEEL
jgi:hypothetical protein